MRSTLLTGFATIAFLTFSAFNTPKAKPEVYNIDTKKSTVTWFGKKFTGSHKGTVALKSGSLTFDTKNLVNGSFIVDMPTIKDTDGSKGLENHLKNDDFFGVDKFPTASFAMKKISGSGANWNVTGDITIKGKTKSITFPAKVTWNADGTVSAVAEKITLDRTHFDIKYKSKSLFSDLGDNFIYDEFEIGVNIVASKGAVSAR